MMETGYPDAPPVRVGTSLADLCGGVYLFSGIVSALYGREKSQRGAHVDIAMFDATLSFLEHGLMAYIATGKSPQRLGNRHPYMAPFDVFDTQDKPITICCGNDKLFSALCQALELTELVNDPRFSSNILRVHNQAILKEYIERTLKTQVAEVWLARIHEVGVPVAPLLSVAEAINLPQTQARNMLIEATICCGNDKLFSALCQALELTELVNDPRFSSNILRVQNQAILKQYIERTLKTQAAEVWLARIHEVGVPVAPLLSVAEAIKLPQTQARNMLIEAGGIMMPGNPIKISGCADPHVMPGAATLDQHGDQIRQEFSS